MTRLTKASFVLLSDDANARQLREGGFDKIVSSAQATPYLPLHLLMCSLFYL